MTHFLFVDNNIDDGGRGYLARLPDVSIWTTKGNYKNSGFGVDWLANLQQRFCCGHCCLTVDLDEFLVCPFFDARPIRALTDWLDASTMRSFLAMMLDMRPKGPITVQPYREGQNPFEIAEWFDSGDYTIRSNYAMGNLWLQGGPRA